MRDWKIIAGFVAGVALSAAVYGQQTKAKGLSVQDYIDIQQLYARYAWSVDTHDQNGMTYTKMWTPDGEFFLNGKSTAKGPEKLAQMTVR